MRISIALGFPFLLSGGDSILPVVAATIFFQFILRRPCGFVLVAHSDLSRFFASESHILYTGVWTANCIKRS
jgi:hypothetical protein